MMIKTIRLGLVILSGTLVSLPLSADARSLSSFDAPAHKGLLKQVQVNVEDAGDISAPSIDATRDPQNILTSPSDSLPGIEDDGQPDLFYDSGIDPLEVPRGTQPTAPEKVDPQKYPAGKIIHVEKNFDRNDETSVIVAAQRALDLGRYDSAADMYNRLYKKNPRDPRILMGRAVALQKTGRVQSAIKTYEELLDVQPNNIEAEISLLGLVRTRFPALALKRMLELFSKDPNNANLSGQIGLAYADVGNFEDAVRYLGMAVSLDPNSALNYYNLAVLYDRQKSYKDAIKMYEEALSKDTVYGGGRSIPRDPIYERLAVIRKR